MINTTNCIKELNKKGFYSTNKIISKKDIKILKNLVKKKLKENNNQYFFLADKKLKNTYINENKFIYKFQYLLNDLSKQLNLKNYKKQKIYKVLRVIAGNRSEKESYRYHFDAHLFTILIPIIIPNKKNTNNGDLIIFPNIRKINNSLVINIIQKILFQNRITKFLLKRNFFIKKRSNVLKLKPENIYIFYGYRTLHGNQNIDSGAIRATLLLHFYDLFDQSKLVKLNRNLRQKREQKIIKKNKK